MEERLSFASYAKCLKAAMKKPYDTQIKITELLLEFLIIPDEEHEEYNAYGREKELIVVDKVMASNLFNNKENVHSSIQKNCDLDIVINGIEKYFKEKVLPAVSLHLIYDLINNMVEIVKSDVSIPELKKKEFLEKAEKNDISSFLSSLFLYVVKKDNKLNYKNNKIKTRDTNTQYYNNYVESLFLHRQENRKKVCLKDLFIIPACEEIKYNGKVKKYDNVINYLNEFFTGIIGEKILFIEGDAGVGKTSLVSFLSYLYIEKTMEWELLFQDKTLLCIRLRDIIPEGMKFSCDTIVKDILKYLNIKSINEFKEIYEDVIIVFDGFDELCMVEGINTNSEYYVYQIYRAFTGYKIIITTRPQYLNVAELNIPEKSHIVLQHFSTSQRKEWVEKYRKTGILDYEKCGIEYILDQKNEEIDSICDTPMIMYMIVAGGIDEEAKHNKWTLYHQIFYKELSDTEYNSMFSNCDGIYNHGIKKYQELIYRLSAEIAYKMYCSGNSKLYLTEQEIMDIINDMEIEDIKIKEIMQHCYALCNYWKVNGKGVVEFYHNNIRDFFLCEKIFYEFNSIYQVCEMLDIPEIVAYINEKIYSLFRYMRLPQKVVEFLYLRARHNQEHDNGTDFSIKEHQKNYLQHFFSDMLQYGGISHYDRDSAENVYENMLNVLANTVRIFRYVLEPHLYRNECIKWYNAPTNIDQAGILSHNFNEIFLSFSLTYGKNQINLISKADFEKIDLRGVDISNADLCGVNLRGAKLNGAKLNNTIFCNASLDNADFREADLSGADLSGADLNNADLRNAKLVDAKLCKAILDHAKLSKAQLSKANLSNAVLTNANLNKGNLKNANLKNADLSNANLNNAILCYTNFFNADLSDAKLSNADLSYAYLIDARLCRAKLNRTKLGWASLIDADLEGAKLIMTDIRNAVLPDKFSDYNQVVQLNHLKEMEIPELFIDSFK